MPGRWASLAIVGFWLLMMGWLTTREMWQRFGSRPKLQDTLAESAQAGPVHWTITQMVEAPSTPVEGEEATPRFRELPLGTAITEVAFDERAGTYRLLQTVHLDNIPIINLDQLLGRKVALDLKCRVDVNMFGDLQRVSLKATLPDFQISCDILGRPHGNGQLQVNTTLAVAGEEHRTLGFVDYDGKDLVLSSLCPLDRMPNLRPGQSWEAPLVDPMETMLAQSFSESRLVTPTISRPAVRVRVREEPEGLLWGREFVPCLVVESKQPDRNVRIFVRQSDGLVLRQTASWGTLSQITLAVTRDYRQPTRKGP